MADEVFELDDSDEGLTFEELQKAGLVEEPSPAAASPIAPDKEEGFTFEDLQKNGLIEPEPEGVLATGAREAVHAAPGLAAALPAASAAATAAAPFAPLAGFAAPAVPLAAGLVAGGGAALATTAAYDWVARKFGFSDEAQRAANRRENPKAAFAGELAPNVAAFRFDKGAALAARALSGGISGGVDLAQQAISGEFDPIRALLATGVGAAFPTPRKWAAGAMAAGEQAVVRMRERSQQGARARAADETFAASEAEEPRYPGRDMGYPDQGDTAAEVRARGLYNQPHEPPDTMGFNFDNLADILLTGKRPTRETVDETFARDEAGAPRYPGRETGYPDQGDTAAEVRARGLYNQPHEPPDTMGFSFDDLARVLDDVPAAPVPGQYGHARGAPPATQAGEPAGQYRPPARQTTPQEVREAQTSEPPKVARGAAVSQPPPPQNPQTIGTGTPRQVRSERVYPKQATEPTAPPAGMDGSPPTEISAALTARLPAGQEMPPGFWTYKAPPAPRLEEATAAGAITPDTTLADWEQFSPGMRREILRSAAPPAEALPSAAEPAPRQAVGSEPAPRVGNTGIVEAAAAQGLSQRVPAAEEIPFEGAPSPAATPKRRAARSRGRARSALPEMPAGTQTGDTAHRGYLIRHNPIQDEYHVSKGGSHVTTAKTQAAAKQAIDDVLGPPEASTVTKLDAESAMKAVARAKPNPDELSAAAQDPDPSAIADLSKRFFDDEAGRLDPRKVLDFAKELKEKVAPLTNWWIDIFQPDMLSLNSRRASAKFSKAASTRQQIIDAEQATLSTKLWYAFEKLGPNGHWDFWDRYELGLPQAEPWMDDAAKVIKDLTNRLHKNEAQWGSQADYVENYLPRLYDIKDQPAARAFFEQQRSQLGGTWFQKDRSLELMMQARQIGLVPKYSNPVDALNHRVSAGARMVSTMQLLKELNELGLAFPSKDMSNARQRNAIVQSVPGEWKRASAPDRQEWQISPDVTPTWDNTVEARGFWDQDGYVGGAFRSWSQLRNAWLAVKLIGPLFHLVHEVFLQGTNNFSRSLKHSRMAGGWVKNMSEAARWSLTDPLFAWQGEKAADLSAPAPKGSLAEAKQARAIWQIPYEEQKPWQKELTDLMNRGGFVPQLSEQLRVDGERAWRKAWNQVWNNKEYAKAWKLPLPGFKYAVEHALQKPVFERWIPNIKIAAYLRSVRAVAERDPALFADPVRGDAALQSIARSTDNRFGEMFYNGLFWNRYVRDTATQSMVSLSWNLGILRQLGTGLTDTGRLARELTTGKLPSNEIASAQYSADDRAEFLWSYIATAMLTGGMMTYALSGTVPQDWKDYFYPRTGDTNPDGTPHRLTSSFSTKDAAVIGNEMNKRGGPGIFSGAGALGALLWHKLLFAPIVHVLGNKDALGFETRDPNASTPQQVLQVAKYLAGESAPIAVDSIRRGYEQHGIRDAVLAFLSFPGAPAYANEDALTTKIKSAFTQYATPSARPYADKAVMKERSEARSERDKALRAGDREALRTAQKRMMDAGMNPRTVVAEKPGQATVNMFGRLDAPVQIELVKGMTPEQFKQFVISNPHIRKNRVALIKAYAAGR